MVSLLLCSSAGDLEESKTTEHSSAIGDEGSLARLPELGSSAVLCSEISTRAVQ